MSGSNKRRSGWRIAILSGVAAITFSIGPVAGQNEPGRSGPVSLLPPAGEQQPIAPLSSPLAPAISVDTLERIGIDRIGLMDEASGAMPEDMWQQSDPAFVRALLPQLPRQMTSLAMRQLARHLLLPQAQRPQDRASPFMLDAGAPIDPGIKPEAETGSWLLDARIAALAAMGDWPSVIALIELIPQDRRTEAMLRTRIDGFLIENQIDAACTEAQAALTQRPDSLWQKILVFCQFHYQQASAAQLGLSLLREEGVSDPVFFWAADVIQGVRGPAPAEFETLPALELAMLRLAGQPFPDSLIKAGDPTTMRVLARMEPAAAEAAPGPASKKISDAEKKKQARAQDENRIVIAERAVELGVLDPAVLRDLYAKLDLSQDPPPVPLAQATAESVSTRAYIYQLAASQNVPAARAEVIARVIDLARESQGNKGVNLVIVGQVYASMLAEFDPSPELIWFAGHAARGLLAAGQRENAMPWIDLANQMGRGSIEAANIANSLWAIEHIMTTGASRALSAQSLRAWQSSMPAVQAASLREGLLNLLTSLGSAIPADEWLPVMGAPAVVGTAPNTPPYIWHGLSLAAREARVGDVAALSLIAFGDAGPHRISPLTVGKTIESLMIVGREADARALAVEAALVQGL